jgi:AraC-like DNA-binding protein
MARDRARAADRVRAFLSDGDAAQATLTDLAGVAGCSRFAAYRAFRSRFGLSPSDYQRQLRLRAARRALASGATVADAAAATGFADQAHLTRWFRRCYGITPGAYRAARGWPPRRGERPGITLPGSGCRVTGSTVRSR